MAVQVLAPEQRNRIGLMAQDWLTMLWRNLIGYIRIPDQIFFSSVQPVMFVLLFRYVFGGAIQTGPIDYVNFLMPGIFVQTVAFGSIGTSIGLADDLQKGLIERFRSLPIAQSSVLVGRTLSDLIRNVFVIVLMTAVGYAVGFRIQTNVFMFLGAVGLMLLVGYALGWGFAYAGLVAPNAETAQFMVFPILMPLTFASSAFVPTGSMPGWLQTFANNQPITIVVNASRALIVGNDTPMLREILGGSTTGLVLKALAWSVGLLVVLAPVAVWRFKRASVK
jgi:ABC transporter DrrB family efflux protein